MAPHLALDCGSNELLKHPTVKRLTDDAPYDFIGTVNADYIIFSYDGKKMYIYKTTTKRCVRTLHATRFMGVTGDVMRSVTIISSNMVMITTEKFGIYFVDFTGGVFARMENEHCFDMRS